MSRRNISWTRSAAVLAFGLAVLAAGAATAWKLAAREAARPSEPVLIANPAGFPVHIREPDSTPCVPTGLMDRHGRAVTVSCSTCHATTTPNPHARRGEDLVTFHQGLDYQHGGMSCLSCHNPGDYDTLRLADGTSLTFRDSRQLCSQCHGTQARDFERGAHGGMSGYWDLARGERHRNTCIDCHDPHAPKFQPVTPVFSPVEFLSEEPIGEGKRSP